MQKCSKSQLSVGDRQYSINYDRKQRTEHLKPNERRTANQQNKSYSKTFVYVSEKSADYPLGLSSKFKLNVVMQSRDLYKMY